MANRVTAQQWNQTKKRTANAMANQFFADVNMGTQGISDLLNQQNSADKLKNLTMKKNEVNSLLRRAEDMRQQYAGNKSMLSSVDSATTLLKNISTSIDNVMPQTHKLGFGNSGSDDVSKVLNSENVGRIVAENEQNFNLDMYKRNKGLSFDEISQKQHDNAMSMNDENRAKLNQENQWLDAYKESMASDDDYRKTVEDANKKIASLKKEAEEDIYIPSERDSDVIKNSHKARKEQREKQISYYQDIVDKYSDYAKYGKSNIDSWKKEVEGMSYGEKKDYASNTDDKNKAEYLTDYANNTVETYEDYQQKYDEIEAKKNDLKQKNMVGTTYWEELLKEWEPYEDGYLLTKQEHNFKQLPEEEQQEMIDTFRKQYNTESPVKNFNPYNRQSVEDMQQYGKDIDLGYADRKKEELMEKYNYTPEEADSIIAYARRVINQENADREISEAGQYGQEHPVIGTLDSIPKNIGSGLGAVSNIWNILERGFSGSETPIDYNSPLNRISQNVNAQREGVKENIKSDLGKFIYDTAVSTADSAATLPINYFVPGATMVILGSSAAQQQMLENHQKGMSDNDAITGGIAAGIFEGLFEQLSLDKIVKTAGGTKSIKDFLKNTAVSMGIEGSEEAFTEIANITYDTLADGEYSDYNASVSAYKSQGYTENEAEKMARKDLAMRVAQSAAGGMLGGALMGAPIGGFNYAANSSYRKMAKYGSNITSGNSVSQLQAFIRKNYSKNQELYKQMENTDFTDDAYVGHLAVSAILSERQRAKQSYNDAVIPAVSRRLEELGVKPEDSEIVAYEVVYRTSDRSGNIVSETGKKYGDIITRVSDELSGTKDGKMQQWVKDIDFSWFEKHNQNAEMLDKLTQGESFAKKADKSTNEKIKEEISKKEQKGYVTGGRAHLLSDKDVTFDITALAVRDTDGKTVAAVKTDEGRTEFFDMDDVSAGKDIVELYLRGQKYSPEQRKTFFMTYDAGGALTSVESFATAFDEAYSQGTQSAGMESLMQDEEMQYSLTPEQIRMAYDAGKLEYEQNVVKKQQANLVKGRGLNHGTVSFDGVDEKKLNKTQKAATEIAKILTKAAGVNIKFFESRVDERGNYKGENGSYDWSTNTIRIDINAGMRSLNEGNNIMTVTLAHELTHYIERFSPEQYGRIQEFIFDKLSQKENENINTLINREIQRLKEEDGQRKAKEKTEEEYRKIAKSEIVARGCELMLTDKDAVKELAVRDRGIFGKLKSKIDKMVQSIEDACNELWDREGNYKPGTVSREARLLEEYAHQIRVLWNDALKEANQVTKIDSNSNEEIGKMIRYDVDNNPFVEISEDILDGIPEEQWNKKVKSVLKSRLKNGVKIGNNIIWQNAAGRKEFVYSKYAKKIYSSDKTLYMDKMRIANNIDEIITASRNYINYDLKHARKDGLKDFAWGTVNMRIGKTDYSADVIVGNSGTKLYLYDVINLKETKIKERRSSHQRYFQNGKVLEIATSSNNSISQNSENDNNILKQDRNTDVIKKAANKLGVSERFLESNLEGRSRESAVQYLRNNNQVKNSFISEKGLEVTPVLKEPTSSYGMSDNIKEFVRDNNISYKTLSENSRLREEYAKLIEHSKDGLGKKFLERRAQDKAQEFIDDMDGAMSGDTEAKEKISREIELAKGKAKAYDDGMSMERGWNELIKNHNKEFEEFISSNIAPMYNNAERNKKEFAQNVKDNVESYVEKAEKHFGTTNDYSLAAYIDINGKMLDFSDGGAIRGTDHRGIAEVLDTPSGVSGTEALTAFMNAGNIRIMDTGIDISVEPNEKQISVLRDYIASRNGEIYVDFSKEDGSPAGSARYSKGTSGGRILADINNYFEDGTIPENTYNAMSDFLYQDRRNTDSEGNTLTKQQQEYFKDSKVRDEDGNLLVVYHGTDADFTVFDRAKVRSSMDIQGSFFSPWELDAGGYGGSVKAYYLNIKNPASESMGYKALNKFKGQNYAGIKAREYLESLGYDGVNNGNEEYIIFNSNQVKLVTNDSPTDNSDIRYQDRRNTDSEGNELTLEQQEYFKDSKVRDDEGRLMVMYHGTPTGGFTVFKNDLQFFTPNKEYASFYEDPSASSRKSGKEKTNPQTYEVYLNMEHPFDIRDEETRELFINDYVKGGWALGINPYEEYKDTTKTGLPSWEEADNIYEWLEENEMLDDYDGIVVDEGGFLGEDNNVVDRGISYVIFNSNQVKLVTNDSPTDNSDIRYQDRTYSYDELVKKPDIKVPVLSAIKTSQYNNRADILNAAMNNLKNDTEVFINGEIAVIYNSDDDKYIEVSKRRLRHGIARRANEASIFVTLNIGDAIKYGIRVNEATGERNNADGAFVLLGKLTNTQGEDYYYRLIINTTNEGEYEVNRLYAAKAKKKVLGGNAPTPAGIKPAKLNTFFKLKVSDFLNEVKDYYVDSLSEDVNNHFGRVRGKSDIEGLLYQNRRISPKTYDEALIDNRGYQKALEHQKEIFNITKGHKPSDRGIERLTYKLIKETKTILSKDELKGAVRSVFDKAVKEKLDTEQVIKELKKVSYRALNEKRQNTKRTEYSQGILDELRNTRIKLTEEQAAGLLSTTGSRFGDWRKSMMGKVIITNNNTGTLLETKWEELSRTYPETFHKDTAPVEQPAELENIIFNLQNDYENDWGFDFEDAAEYCATEVLAEYSRLPEVKNSVAETDVLGELQNSYDTQLGKVRVEYYKRIKEFRKGQIKGIQEARKQWLEERKDRERQLKIRYENLMNQRIANIKNREDSAWMTRDKEKIRNNIIRKVKRLNTLVVRPTNQKHAPQGFLKKTAEFCQLFMDNTSVFSQSALDNLKLAYAALKPDSKDGNGNRVSYVLQDSYDVDIEDMIETLRNTIAGKRLAQLTLEELNTVNDIVNHFDTIVKNETEMEVNGRKQNIEAVSHDFMAELQEKGQYAEYDNPVSNTTGELLYNNLTPVYFFKRLGKTATRLFNDILEGQNKGGKNIYKARIFVLELKKRRHYDSWDFNKTVKLGDGIELNVEQAMYVYATAKREKQNIRQSAQHLSKGGIILKEKLVFEEDKDRKLRPKRKAAQQRSYHVRAFDLAEISNFLTAEQKAYADEMVGYLSKDMAELGNETSMQLYGFEKFDEDYYFPYKTADTYIEHSATGHKDVEPSLIAQSFTKKLQDKASNPVIIGDFTETAAEHINRMIVYNALAVAQNNLNKVFNYVEIFRDEETGEITGTGDSLKQMIEGTHGEKARKFFDSFIVSLNGGLKSDPVEGSAAKLLSMFKKARTYMSASVIIQQPSSVCRAMALIDPKYFNKILVTKKHWEECKKYNGVAVIKEMGGFDTGMGKGAVDYISDKKAETVMGKIQERVDNSLYAQLPGKMDEITWCTIWNAVKNETRDKGGFKGDEEAFFKAASERFNEVINKTQVYDSVIAKSANMNSKSGMMKMATAFMSEPTLSYNMLVDAGRKGAGKKYAARTVASLIMQIVTNGLLKALIQAARNSRDEDRDKSYWEKYVKAFSGNVFGEYFTGELNPLTWIPYARDVMSLLNGYDIERTDMAVLSDLTDALLNTAKMFDEDSDVSCFDVLKEWASSISAFTGIPVENLIRDGQAVWNLGNDFVNNNILPGNKTKLFNAFAEGMGFKTTDEDRIKDYLKSGDKKVLSELISEESDKAREEHLGYTDKMIEKEARSNVRKAITRVLKDYYFSGDLEKDDVIKKMKQTGLYLDDKGKDNSKDTLVDWEIAELKKQYLEVASGQENFEARKKIRKKLWETKHWKRLKDLDKQLKSWTQ